MKTKRKAAILLMTAFYLLVVFSGAGMAKGFFYDGTVTKRAWGKTPQKIEINGEEYIIRPGLVVYEIVMNDDESAFDMVPKNTRTLRPGTDVLYKEYRGEISDIQIKP